MREHKEGRKGKEKEKEAVEGGGQRRDKMGSSRQEGNSLRNRSQAEEKA